MSDKKNIPDPIQLPLYSSVVIVLTRGYITIVDAADTDLAMLKWSAKVDTYGKVYAVRSYPKEDGSHGVQFLHRVILERKLNRKLDPEEECDHISTVRMDNRRQNLCPASRTQNMQNKNLYSSSTSGYKGVTQDPRTGRWRSRIGVEKKRIALGCFATPEEAYAAYCEAARKYFGEFARLE